MSVAGAIEVAAADTVTRSLKTEPEVCMVYYSRTLYKVSHMLVDLGCTHFGFVCSAVSSILQGGDGNFAVKTVKPLNQSQSN